MKEIKIIFEALTKDQMELIRKERNSYLVGLRTPYLVSKEMQEEYYKNVICNRNHNSRFFAVMDNTNFVGMTGLQNIEWENSRAEISIILLERYRKKGLGTAVIEKLLATGFKDLDYLTFGVNVTHVTQL